MCFIEVRRTWYDCDTKETIIRFHVVSPRPCDSTGDEDFVLLVLNSRNFITMLYINIIWNTCQLMRF